MKTALSEKLQAEKEMLETELAKSNGNDLPQSHKDYFPGFEIGHVYKLMDQYNHCLARIAECEAYEVDETAAPKKTARKRN